MNVPNAVDLREPVSREDGRRWRRKPVRQLSNDDCTSIALAGAVEYLEWKRGNDVRLSSRFLHARALADYPGGRRARCSIEEELEVLGRRGICRFDLWPYRAWGSVEDAPDDVACDMDALEHRVVRCERLPRGVAGLTVLRTRLAAGFPAVFGYLTYTSSTSAARWRMWAGGWASKDNPTLPVPFDSEPALPGSLHDVMVIGYDEERRALRIRNSLSPSHFWMPYDFVLTSGSTSDFYVITGLAGAVQA
jgi:hypothetical protein